MLSLDAALKTYDVLAALHALPDKASLTTAEAALFLRLSPKTMERMRLDGSGPPYIQGGAANAKGGNQKCLYFKEDLLAWQKGNQISNAMQAAVRKGQAFRTIFDLVAEVPFYINVSGQVVAAVEDLPLNIVIGRLGASSLDIVWLPPADAAAREWSNVLDHREFATHVVDTLLALRARTMSALEATEMKAALNGHGPF